MGLWRKTLASTIPSNSPRPHGYESHYPLRGCDANRRLCARDGCHIVGVHAARPAHRDWTERTSSTERGAEPRIASLGGHSIANGSHDSGRLSQASRRERRARDPHRQRQDTLHRDRESVQGHADRRRRNLRLAHRRSRALRKVETPIARRRSSILECAPLEDRHSGELRLR